MQSMTDVARSAIEQMPPACRFRPQDAQIIYEHKELLLGLEPEVVKGFYDTVYGHGPTAAVFVEGERADRETTLSHWWRRTVNGPLNEQYFAWMAMVGLVHVMRGVQNPMMLAMADWTVGVVADKVVDAAIGPADADHLVEAFRRLASTVGAIITSGYDQAVVDALYNVAGMPEALLRRLRDQEVAAALDVARDEMRRPPQ
jgi:hypothetical protein